MRKLYLLLIPLLMKAFELSAIPATPRIINLMQSDGTMLEVGLHGDEFVHYFTTLDGIPVFETAMGYCYGRYESGSVEVSDVIAHNKEYRTAEENNYLKENESTRSVTELKQLHSIRLKEANERRTTLRVGKKSLGQFGDYKGKRKGLVILVDFANLTMQPEHSNSTFNRFFNEKGYSDNDCIGSVHDYFSDQSYGEFSLTFDVVGPDTVSRTCGYYGQNSEQYGNDKRVREMVVEACQLADESVDYSNYDWDGDGEVDQVFLIYAGYGESEGAPSNTIWPHESQLGSNALTLDGVTISTYACSCELSGNSGNILTGIGTSCHEFCHCLGLPDTYDTDYSGAFGMGAWDIMNSGGHSGPNLRGEIPYGFTAYERWMAGWITPVELDHEQSIRVFRNLGDFPIAYVVYNQANRNEYYLLENHQPQRWYQYIRDYEGLHGMLVTHVDYDSIAWVKNLVNPNASHQRMSIIPADNRYGQTESDYAGDPYPGFQNVEWLTNTSHQSVGGRLFNLNTDGTYNMNCAFGNIKEKDGVISFDFIYDVDVITPVVKPASDLTIEGYTANWNPVENAEYYLIEQSCIDFGNGKLESKRDSIGPIYENNVRLNWLTTNETTKYRVKAMVNGVLSPWSVYANVSYASIGGVGSIFNDVDDRGTEIYTIDGCRKERIDKNGIYIIKRNGKVSKIIVNTL